MSTRLVAAYGGADEELGGARGPGRKRAALNLRIAERAAFLACVALLLAGIGGVLAVGHRHHFDHPDAPSIAVPSSGGDASGSTDTPGSSGTASATTVAPPGPPATAVPSSTLETDLLTANDLGGYYQGAPSESAPRLAASGCLAPLGSPRAGRNRAVQDLQTEAFSDQLPNINEQLTSYPTGSAAAEVFAQLSAALRACRSTTLALPVGSATATLAPLTVTTLPADNIESTAAQGPFHVAGITGKLTVAVVQQGTTIVVFVYADKNPPSAAILGSAQSTLASAVGKASSP